MRRASGPPARYVALDEIDRRLILLLQQDGRSTNQALAADVGLSPSACLARVRRLEASGVIAGYHAEVAAELVGPSMVIFAELTLRKHLIAELDAFDAVLDTIPAVVEAYRISGAYDYLLKAVVSDLREWREIAHNLLRVKIGVDKITIHICYDRIRLQGRP